MHKHSHTAQMDKDTGVSSVTGREKDIDTV